MKNNRKTNGKKIFFVLSITLVLLSALSVGTTLGKYSKTFPHKFNVEFVLTQDILDGGKSGDPADTDNGPGIEEEAPTTVYQVQPGDTLDKIAEKFETTVKKLIAYNELKDPVTIESGMILRIPPKDYVIPETVTE